MERQGTTEEARPDEGTATKRGPYAKTAGVRQRILEAALEVFGSKGFRSTTMKEVAERGGISQRGLVHHFPTKEDLLLDVLRRYEEGGAALVAKTGIEHLTQGLRISVARNRDHPHLVELQVLLSAEAAEADHPAHSFFEQKYLELRQGLAAEVTTTRGHAAVPEIPAERIAAMYVALLDGLQLQWLYHPEVDVDQCLRDFLSLVNLDGQDQPHSP